MMLEEIRHTDARTYRAEIFIGGDYSAALTACRGFVMRGLCVSVSPCDFVYTGGMEAGVRVLLINYPRFPKPPEEIRTTAVELAEHLIHCLYQSSASVVTDTDTVWLSRRSE